jgi:hypothetical protein
MMQPTQCECFTVDNDKKRLVADLKRALQGEFRFPDVVAANDARYLDPILQWQLFGEFERKEQAEG